MEYKKPYTCKHLDDMGIKDYKVIVEEKEYELYKKSIPEGQLITLPQHLRDRGEGSIPARNYIHYLNIHNNNEYYWILDDNIDGWQFVDGNVRIPVKTPIAFRMVEDYVENTSNLYLAGHQYKMFVPPGDYHCRVQFNTRVYSSILIKTKAISRVLNTEEIWRGKYNEDTDLSLRILKEGLPTAIFYTINADKLDTNTSKGGNKTNVYADDNNGSGVLKSNALLEHHSDCVKIVKKFGRTHHTIDIERFKKNEVKWNGTEVYYDLQ
jgi:hypothetical protein